MFYYVPQRVAEPIPYTPALYARLGMIDIIARLNAHVMVAGHNVGLAFVEYYALQRT